MKTKWLNIVSCLLFVTVVYSSDSHAEIILDVYTDIVDYTRSFPDPEQYQSSRPLPYINEDVKIDCEELERRKVLNVNLNKGRMLKLQERSLAINANDHLKAELLSEEIRILDLKIKRNLIVLKVLESEKIDPTVVPNPSAKVLFILGQSGNTFTDYFGPPWPPTGTASYNTIESIIPAGATSTNNYRTSELAFERNSNPGSRLEINFRDDCGNIGYQETGCTLFKMINVRLNASRAEVCDLATFTNGDILRFRVTYDFDEISKVPIVINYHFGYDIRRRQHNEIEAENLHQSVIIDKLLKEFILDFLGNVQTYRTSDDILQKIEASDCDLREPLNEMNDGIQAKSGVLTDETLINYLSTTKDRYSDMDDGVVVFTFRDGKSKAELGFFRMNDGKLGVKYLALDNKTIVQCSSKQ